MSLCKDCVAGVTHEGTPTGKIEIIGGIESYVATPKGDYPKDKVLLYLSDIFGIPLVNNKLLADDFARNGFKVVLPDILNGDSVPIEVMEAGNFDIGAWFSNHSREVTRAPIDKVITALKADGVKEFGALGYCFGARYGFDLALDQQLKVLAISHPSLLQFPTDFEKYVSSTSTPLLINSCETDSFFPAELHEKVDEIFGKYTPGYKREYFPGCKHGFAVRGDVSIPAVKAGKEGAFKASVDWLAKYW
ncbi:alpha/beta-hydrolase [Cylindrobasidium torrendii FP15055 ss-10]|uniref:Alpha/beta-hydrolase n=1 Tax=Cylindrobasidium torrendii FP15055 ss-10 TaxID=1314674 RepID=A0A0D7B5I4_9AGAR|nr:alpha/beta-hydrolase [Cylindrobasidium torrendii FP15055 ss-10]